MQPYSFNITKNNYYEFTSIAGNHYACYFVSMKDYLGEYPEISSDVFMFNIELMSNSKKKTDTDERLALTVVNILKRFLSSKEYAAVYVCDNIDNKHEARNRKFNVWFARFDDGSIIKIDNKVVIEKSVIYNSLLLHKDNPLKNRFIEAFIELNNTADNK